MTGRYQVTLDQLLRDLRVNAERPFEEAHATPRGICTSPEYLTLEQERVFAMATRWPERHAQAASCYSGIEGPPPA